MVICPGCRAVCENEEELAEHVASCELAQQLAAENEGTVPDGGQQ